MLHEIRENKRLEYPFAKKGEDINNGDRVKILAEAEQLPSRFKAGEMQNIIAIETRNGARFISLNQTSINILAKEFQSKDDTAWVGKDVKILLAPKVIAGQRVKVAFLAGMDYELDEYMEPVKPGEQSDQPDDIPTVQIDESDDEVKIEDIPF